MKQPSIAAIAAVIVAAIAAAPATAHATEQHAWVKEVRDAKTWKAYSKTVGSDELGKCIIDVKTNDIYFFDVNLFNIHADFVLGILLKKPWTADNIREYNLNYERVKPKFILCYLTHHLKVDKWTFSYWEGDKVGADDVVRTKSKLDATFFVKNLLFRPDSPMQQKVAAEVGKRGLKTITNDDIYKAAEFQAFTRGKAVGKLHVVPTGTPYDKLNYDRHDIVLLQESYPDITPVAGIIATQFSTPLSHVNLRAGAWGIPNAGDKKARERYGKLDGKVVYYEVTDTAITLREATADEKKQLEGKIAAAKHVDLPPANLDNRRLAMLTRMRAKDVIVYGTKASNLGEIVTANLEGVRVPMGFGVPFYYYEQHLKRNHLDDKIEAMLKDPQWKDASWRKTALEALRKQIMDAPIDPDTLDMIYKRSRSVARVCSCAARRTPRICPGSRAPASTTPSATWSASRASPTRCASCGRRSGTCARSTSARRSASTTTRSTWRCSCRSASTRPRRACSSPRTCGTPPTRTGSRSTRSGGSASASSRARSRPSR
jgi:hypothetical protein